MPSRDVGVALGTFDLFHAGHVIFLRFCKQHVKTLFVALNPDEFAKTYKRRPIYSLQERRILLSACRYVDKVIVNTGGADSRPAILESGAALIFHGDDWTGDSLKGQLGLNDVWLAEHGVDLVYIRYTQGVSSSVIEERVMSRCALSR